LALLKEQLRVGTKAVDPQHIDRLIADLDADRSAVREKAMRELERAGRAAESALAKALKSNPSAEQRRRLRALLEPLEQTDSPSEALRRLRALEVLERIATPEAIEVLQVLARGTPEARLTQEAQAALQRLAGRPAAGRAER
jgi:hypothetical protein